ncbi:hypothetical protein JXQ31_16460 [candidate division KSB1 bacterium]|nr:hypothetical protein [candidate division KSB1 bacterium]
MKTAIFSLFKSRMNRIIILSTLILIYCAGFSYTYSKVSDIIKVSQDQQGRFEKFKSLGDRASLTVLPVTFGLMTDERIGMVVGILLERAGMQNIELENLKFSPPDINDYDSVQTGFAEFVRNNPVKTDYVLYTQFLVEQRSITEVRGIIVDKNGKLVWTDRQTNQDDAFTKAKYQPKDPMTGCMFLAERLRTQLGLKDPMREDAPESKIEKMMAEKDGLPSKEEIEAIQNRCEQFKQVHSQAKLLVYPVLVLENEVNESCAQNLAGLFIKSGLCLAKASDEGPVIKYDKNIRGLNVLLWSVARSFQGFVRESKPDADYVLYAHYGFNPQHEPRAFFVHFVICDRNGDWVITDLANSDHEDFQQLNPQSLADCDLFVAQRLEGYLGE